MKTQYELFPLPKSEIIPIEKFDIHDIGYDKHYDTDYRVLPKGVYYIYKTGGINRYQKNLGPVFPYIKNENKGNRLAVASTNTDHYVRTNLRYSKDGKFKSKVCRIHRVVGFAFLTNPDPKNYAVVHHKNGNVLDYRIENLEWTSQSQNMMGVKKFDEKYVNRHAVLEEKGKTFDF